MKRQIISLWRRIATRPSFAKINIMLLDCATHGLGVGNWEDENWSGEANFLKKLLVKYVRADAPVFIDVGANVGDYSLWLRRHYPNSKILAFEPNPKTFARLRQAICDDKTILIDKGLGATEGTLPFFDRGDCDGSSAHGSLYEEVITGLHKVGSVRVDVRITTLDQVLQEHSINRVSLLKIDTEGHELAVLRGAEKSLRKGLIDVIQLEFNETNIISKVFFRDLIEFLPEYVPYRLLPKGVLKLKYSPRSTELFAFQNLVFVHGRFQPNKAMEPGIDPGSAVADFKTVGTPV
jgi:FkbM family methyltransferase